MDQNSAESRSGDAMSIFAQSIDVTRRPGKSRRRATLKFLSPEIEQQAKANAERRHQRRAVVERDRARAEFELSRATTMATELERQIEQISTKASSHRPGLQGTRVSGSGRRKKGLFDVVEAPGPGGNQTLMTDTLYVEVMQELDRVKRELRKLQREVTSATEAMGTAERDAEPPTPSLWEMRSDSRVPDGDKREAGVANEERVAADLAEAGAANEERAVVELAEAGKAKWRNIAEHAGASGLCKGMQMQRATRTRAKVVIRSDISSSGDTEDRFATASSSDVENEESSLSIKHYVGEHHDDASQQAAEAGINSARADLASIKEEGLRFTSSIERTREETARVAEEISRLNEQEKKASAQVQQLNAKLLKASARLEAVTAADESAEAALAELTSALRLLSEETAAAEKEKALAELESQRVREDAASTNAETAEAERRVRQSMTDLEAARAAEAAATAKLKAAVDSAVLLARAAAVAAQGGNVTIARSEYEYLTGRAEVVRAAAEKKVAVGEAWAEALRAGEKEVELRAEAIEREIGEANAAGEADDVGCRREAAGIEPSDDDGSQLRAPRRIAAAREVSVTPGRIGTPSSSLARKPVSPSFKSSCLKVIAGKCRC